MCAWGPRGPATGATWVENVLKHPCAFHTPGIPGASVLVSKQQLEVELVLPSEGSPLMALRGPLRGPAAVTVRERPCEMTRLWWRNCPE